MSAFELIIYFMLLGLMGYAFSKSENIKEN